MHRMHPRRFAAGRAGWLLTFVGAVLAPTFPAHAQPPATLAEAFAQAWARHPSAQALPDRQAELAAHRRAADAWTAQPGALELRAKADRPGTDRGAQEFEFGVALPLGWPGQRSQSQALAAQAEQALSARQDQARLQLAGELREAWWTWQRSQAEQALIGTQVAHAQALAQDVHRRVQAGDLARADAHQADGALARAQAEQARAESVTLLAWQALQGLLGGTDDPPTWAASGSPPIEPAPEPEPSASDDTELTDHPLVRERDQQAALARQAASLADTQSRANPELLLGTVQSRDQRGEPRQRQLTVGLRLPWGDSPALQAQAARARAEATELSAQAELQRQRVSAAWAGARARVDAAKRAHAAAQRRAQLAQEALGFYDQSFQLGETDLPTRLRIAQDAQDAARQAALAAIDVAAATSAWRQAAGLLPQ